MAMLHDELDEATNELSRRVIGAAIEVHRTLGPGLDEALYESALAVEFIRTQISFERQVPFSVNYKGVLIGDKRFDFVINGEIIVELKAVEALNDLHKAQLRTYLMISGKRLGLLINFNVKSLKDGIVRLINTPT